jgi:hypothetical protein
LLWFSFWLVVRSDGIDDVSASFATQRGPTVSVTQRMHDP